MSNDFEGSKSELQNLVTSARAKDASLVRNEADTCLQLVDRIIFQALGWNPEDCRAEERFDGKYSDYTLGNPRRLIVEAKREGIHFQLPAGFDRRVCKLETLFDGNKGIEEAVKQCLTYCLDRGSPFGAVCNGHQIIAFLGSRADGVPPIEGRCLVFRSLEDMLTDFRILWDNLSKSGVSAFVLSSTLSTEQIQLAPEKLSQRIPTYPGFKNRNPFQTELKILGELFIEDVVSAPELEDEFLRQCYTPSGALSQYALISKQILQARYSSLFEKELAGPAVEPVQTKHGLSEGFTTDVLAASLKRRAIILLGDVGVGKTIFIRHLIKIAARDVFEKALSLYLDFGKEPALAEDLQKFVLNRCASQLLKDHEIDVEEDRFIRGVYHSDLARFSKGVYGQLSKTDPELYLQKEIEFLFEKIQDKSAHLRACLNHISKAHKRQIVIFLDNIDQRPIDFQDRVFIIGQSLAETWPATVFISLRPDTFYQSKIKGSLAAYQPRVFTIAPPRVDQIITARLAFALDQLKSTRTLRSLPSALSFGSTSLNRYIQVLLDSFQKSKELIAFIDNLSGGNTRQALGFVTAFISSGHVNAEKIIAIADEFGSYVIPVHEFTRAVIFGDFEYFDPSASPVVNLFDISSTDGREHFLLGTVLSFIQRAGDSTNAEGFVETSRIYDFAQNLGFVPSQVNFALQRARAKKLVDTSPRFAEATANSYRISSIGAYTCMELVKQFAYFDAIIVDTPIVDPETRKHIGDTQQLSDRLDRVDVFVKYLHEQYSPLVSKAITFDWLSIRASLAFAVTRIRDNQDRREKSRRYDPHRDRR